MMVTAAEYMRYYDRYMSDLEEPVGHEPAAAFYFVAKIASDHVKVALSGQGADEPWAGYDRYKGVKLSRIYSRMPKFVTNDLAHLIGKVPGRNERLKRGRTSPGQPALLH